MAYSSVQILCRERNKKKEKTEQQGNRPEKEQYKKKQKRKTNRTEKTGMRTISERRNYTGQT